jgi:hypothetical protein
VHIAAQTYAADVSKDKPEMQLMFNVLSDHSLNQYETNSRSQIIGHDPQLGDIILCNKPKTHNQLGANDYEDYQTTQSNIYEVQYDFKITKTSVWKRQQCQRLFEAHYCTAPKTRWAIITQIPPMLVANFYTLKFQKKRNAKKENGSKKVLFKKETNGVEHH